jgi:outer membrane receptor protein involved in Fe transport
VQIPGFRTPTVFGGNPELVPESGETWTAGVLLDVRNFYHLQASLDYWQVTLDQAIDVVDPQTIANECANTGSSAACERITRFPDGAISQIDSRFANVSRYVTEGIDAALAMFTEAGGGTLAVQLDGTYLQTVEITRFASGTTFAVAGIFDPTTLISWPRWRAQAALDWTAGPWRVSYAAQYIDSFRECGDKNFFLYAFLTDDDCRTVDDRLYHDVSATYRFSRGLVVTGAIENVGDTDPPRLNRSQAANTDQSIYRLLGRTYSLGISYAF